MNTDRLVGEYHVQIGRGPKDGIEWDQFGNYYLKGPDGNRKPIEPPPWAKKFLMSDSSNGAEGFASFPDGKGP